MKRLICLIFAALVFLSACAPKEAVRPDEEAKEEDLLPPLEEVTLPVIKPEKEKPAEKPGKAEQPAVPEKEEEQYIMLNFENADLETVISTIGEMLNINYILTPGITGKITIQSHQKIPISELFYVFQTMLEFNGFTAVKDGSFYRIVPIDTAKQQPVPIEEGKMRDTREDAGFVTQWVPLEYVKANDVANIVRNLMPKGTDIIVYEPSNMLIVTALPSGIIKLLKLLEAIDIPSTERDTIRTFVYYVENGEASKLASILKSIYLDKKSEDTSPVKTVTPAETPAVPTPTPVPRRPSTRALRTPAVPTASTTVQEGLAGQIEGDIVIEAYEDINALIVKTTPRGYITLLETLKKLDIQPKQVLIEVLIAEVTLDDSMKMGIEWLLRSGLNTYGFTSGNITFSTGGEDGAGRGFETNFSNLGGNVFANIVDPAGFKMIINAAAGSGKVNVLASPHILALDNQEAKIEIGDEVPVATSISQPQTTTDNTISQVQYRQTGTILTVTPHVNEKKQVTLELTQEASELGKIIPIGTGEFQGFTTRKATTTAIVQDGHTLVIGGIITEREEASRSGMPFLSRIPVLGYLFGTSTDSGSRRELILMVTPYVVGSHEEADMLTEEFENRVLELKRRIDQRIQQYEDTPKLRDMKHPFSKKEEGAPAEAAPEAVPEPAPAR